MVFYGEYSLYEAREEWFEGMEEIGEDDEMLRNFFDKY